jgi:hypothetical protein
MATRPKRPRDPFQLAKLIGDISTGQAIEENPDAGKNLAAVELGRLGGKKGGAARAKKLSPEQRVDIAKKAIASRWSKSKPEPTSVSVQKPRKKVKVSL